MMNKKLILILLLLSGCFMNAFAGNEAALKQQNNVMTQKLKVGVMLNQPPFSYKNKLGQYDGLSVTLWKGIAKELGYDYEFVEYKSDPQQAAIDLSKNKYDVIVSPFSVTYSRMDLLDFSRPYFLNKIGVAISSINKSKYVLLIGIFSKAILIMFVVLSILIFLMGILIWLFERKANHDIPRKFFRGVGYSMWMALGVFLRFREYTGITVKGRFIITAWLFIAITFMTSITAVATASLTLSLRNTSSSIKKLSDINDTLIAVEKGSASEPFAQNLGAKLFEVKSTIEGLKDIGKNGVVGYMGDYYLINYYLGQNEVQNVKMTPLIISNDEYAFAFPKNSKIKGDVNGMLVQFQENKFSSELCSKYIGRKFALNCVF